MNKFKFKLKITGLELEVEGSKEDVTLISNNISNQLKGLVQPAGIAESEPDRVVDQEAKVIGTTKQRKAKRASAKPTEKGAIIQFINDPKKYGAPTMEWATLDKSLWILYVVGKEKSVSELSAAQIADTFNVQFKQAKIIRGNNVSRDLGLKKMGNKALVGENTVGSPSKWYLTDEGTNYVQQLISSQGGKNGVS